MKIVSTSLVCAAFIVSTLGHPGVLQADVLVTHDGSRIETDGAWTVDGRLVRFTSADGTLSVIRLSEIDLDASEQATRDANAPPPPPVEAPAEPVQPVLVLTDEDIPTGEGNAGTASADGDAGDGDGAEDGTTSGSEAQQIAADVDPQRPLAVSDWSWRAATVDGGLWELEGTVVNRGNRDAYNLQVYFTAVGLDEENRPRPDMDLLRPALVVAEELAAGENTTFSYVVRGGDLRGDPSRFAEPQITFDLRYKLRPAPVATPDGDEVDGEGIGSDLDAPEDATADDEEGSDVEATEGG